MQDDDITVYSNLTQCPYPIGYFYKRSDRGRLEKHPKGCGRWDCPYCGERKKKKLLDRIAAYYRSRPNECRMLTLTLQQDVDDSNLTMYWNRLRASLLKYGIKFQFVWIKEFQKNGQRHLHVLLDKWVRKGLIKRLWLKATDFTSYIIRINHRPIRSAAGYISKYVTKDVQNEARYKRGERRYSFSRGFQLPKREKSDEWALELDGGAFQGLQRASLRELMQQWNESHHHDPPADPEKLNTC